MGLEDENSAISSLSALCPHTSLTYNDKQEVSYEEGGDVVQQIIQIPFVFGHGYGDFWMRGRASKI